MTAYGSFLCASHMVVVVTRRLSLRRQPEVQLAVIPWLHALKPTHRDSIVKRSHGFKTCCVPGQGDGHQAKRKFLSDARAAPPLVSGMITSSSVLTPGISTA